MIGMIVVEHRGPHRRSVRRRKPTLREIAKAVSVLQVAEGAALHARRDGCVLHASMAAIARHQCMQDIPRRLLRDQEWVHQHIEAPGMRIQARIDDHMAAS